MVDFLKKRLQVFVSSTYSDLISERQAAVEAILTAGHIPAGMELFTSGDESQMDVIRQWIDESDVFLLILGGRYGSIEPKTGKSYIHLEYEYAVNAAKPLFSCVINDGALDEKIKEHGRDVLETKNSKEYDQFKEIVLSKMVRFWDDRKDIKIAVGETLSHFSRKDELIGWIRGGQETDAPALANEIARLSKENSELRERLVMGGPDVSINGLSFDEAKKIAEKKGLIDILTNFSYELAEGELHETEGYKQLTQLSLLGLVERSSKSSVFYALTDAGRIFLNKLEAEKLPTQD